MRGRIDGYGTKDNPDGQRAKKLRKGNSSVTSSYIREPESQRNSNKDIILSSGFDIPVSSHSEATSWREKLPPIRGALKPAESQSKASSKVVKRSVDTDRISLKDMLRFLEEEEAILLQLQSKMAAELSHLQVEEHIFLHTFKISSEKEEASSCETQHQQQQSSSQGHELIGVLNVASAENGESNQEKGVELVDKGSV